MKVQSRIFITGLLLIIVIAAFAQSDGHPWAMFGGHANHTGRADVVGPETPNVKWTVEVGESEGEIGPNSVVVSSDGIIYVAGVGRIMAIDEDGEILWEKDYPGTRGPSLSPDGEHIYFLSQESIIALNPDGEELWQFNTDGTVLFGAIVGEDGTLYRGSWDGYLYAISPDGELLWKHQTDGCLSYAVSIDSEGIIYQGGGDAHCGRDSHFYVLSPDGEVLWTFDTGDLNQRVGTPAITADGIIYVPTQTLFALDKDGQVLWTLENNISGIITPAIAPDGTIYIGSPDGVIYAINHETQEIEWTFQTGPDPEKPDFYGVIGFPVVDAEGTLYVGAVDGVMYAIRRDGSLKWSIQTGDRIPEAAPAFGADGTFYFTSDDGLLYAIGAE